MGGRRGPRTAQTTARRSPGRKTTTTINKQSHACKTSNDNRRSKVCGQEAPGRDWRAPDRRATPTVPCFTRSRRKRPHFVQLLAYLFVSFCICLLFLFSLVLFSTPRTTSDTRPVLSAPGERKDMLYGIVVIIGTILIVVNRIMIILIPSIVTARQLVVSRMANNRVKTKHNEHTTRKRHF